MEKKLLEYYIKTNKSSYAMAKHSEKSQTTIMYWLNKYNLKSNHPSFKERGIIDYNGFRICPTCKIKKALSEYYNRRGKPGSGSHCKSCIKISGRDRARRFKQQCVDYKGGKCEICGYSKSISAFDFHHINPSEKSFGINKVKHNTFSEKIKKELDKCMLLCSNCHREIHEIK